MLSWRLTVERPYNWATRGRAPQDAVWRRALYDEAADADGQETGTVLVDLTKAFEMVRLDLVWKTGLRTHMHPVILSLVLESFAFARRLTADGVVTEPVHSLSAILAGGGFATDALFVVLRRACDELLIMHPEVDMCLFVDDLTIHCSGSQDYVIEQLTSAVDDVIGMFRN